MTDLYAQINNLNKDQKRDLILRIMCRTENHEDPSDELLREIIETVIAGPEIVED